MSDEKKEKIVVLGFGWVGQANAIALVQMGYQVFYYDIVEPKRHYERDFKDWYTKIKPLGQLLEKDDEFTWYIVAVGDRVRDDGTQDTSLIKKALDELKNARGGIILRSTVLPPSLKELSFDYYLPEFLHEKYAVKECLYPHFFVIGSRQRTAKLPSFFAIWAKNSYKTYWGTPEEASYIKYLSNLWNAVRIAFVNEFGDTISQPNSPENIKAIEKIVNFVFEGKFYLRYGGSFSGHCLPKDTLAFYNWLKKEGKNAALLEGAYQSNEIHRQIAEKHKILPEWFSEWQKSDVSGRVALTSLWKIFKKRLKNLR